MSDDERTSDEQIDEGPLPEDLKEFGRDKPDNLAPCPFCGAQIYDEGDRCPQCGQYIVRDQTEPTRWPVWIVITIIAIAAAIAWAVWKS